MRSSRGWPRPPIHAGQRDRSSRARRQPERPGGDGGRAATGAAVARVLPADLSCDDFEAIIGAIASLARRYAIHVVGGNLTRSPGPLMIDIMAAGTVKPRQALTRSGARPGDELYVTGSIGAAAAGLEMLRVGRADLLGPPLSGPPSSDLSGPPNPCISRYLYPEPRVRTGLLLARNRAATACVDLSDGLGDAVARLAEASGVGAVIDGDALPIEPDAAGGFSSAGRARCSRQSPAGMTTSFSSPFAPGCAAA